MAGPSQENAGGGLQTTAVNIANGVVWLLRPDESMEHMPKLPKQKPGGPAAHGLTISQGDVLYFVIQDRLHA